MTVKYLKGIKNAGMLIVALLFAGTLFVYVAKSEEMKDTTPNTPQLYRGQGEMKEEKELTVADGGILKIALGLAFCGAISVVLGSIISLVVTRQPSKRATFPPFFKLVAIGASFGIIIGVSFGIIYRVAILVGISRASIEPFIRDIPVAIGFVLVVTSLALSLTVLVVVFPSAVIDSTVLTTRDHFMQVALGTAFEALGLAFCGIVYVVIYVARGGTIHGTLIGTTFGTLSGFQGRGAIAPIIAESKSKRKSKSKRGFNPPKQATNSNFFTALGKKALKKYQNPPKS